MNEVAFLFAFTCGSRHSARVARRTHRRGQCSFAPWCVQIAVSRCLLLLLASVSGSPGPTAAGSGTVRFAGKCDCILRAVANMHGSPRPPSFAGGATSSTGADTSSRTLVAVGTGCTDAAGEEISSRPAPPLPVAAAQCAHSATELPVGCLNCGIRTCCGNGGPETPARRRCTFCICDIGASSAAVAAAVVGSNACADGAARRGAGLKPSKPAVAPTDRALPLAAAAAAAAALVDAA
jgi:hypothetical protein